MLNPEEVEYNNQIAFDIAEKELGIPPEMNGAEMANCDVPDRLTLTSYLTKIYELLKVGSTNHYHHYGPKQLDFPA